MLLAVNQESPNVGLKWVLPKSFELPSTKLPDTTCVAQVICCLFIPAKTLLQFSGNWKRITENASKVQRQKHYKLLFCEKFI